MNRKIRTGAAVLAVFFVAMPIAAAQAPPPVVTTCTGGATRSALIVAVDDDSKVVGDTTGWYYVDLLDRSLWKENNPAAGLQITDLICTERHAVTGAFVRSYVAVPRDMLLAGGEEGVGQLFLDLLEDPSVENASRTAATLLP